MLELLDGKRLINIVSFLERLVELLLQGKIIRVSLLGSLESFLIFIVCLGIGVLRTGSK